MARLVRQRRDYSYKKIIKINPFDNAQIALNIIAKICSWESQDNITIFKDFEKVALNGEDSSDNLKIYFLEKRQQRDVMNLDFWNELVDRLAKLKIELEAKEREVKAKIIVSGSVNAGKSSFLNKVFQIPELLPTDIQACSLIPTYIYNSSNIYTEEETKVLGLNFKDVVGPLDMDVLQYIKHESSNNIYISSVLKKLFIEIKENEYIKDLAFIDTPGYNYIDESDKNKAIQSLSEGNVLFWVVDVATGAIKNSDKEFISKNFNGKYIVIIFNKADLSPTDTVTTILQNAKETFKEEYDSGQLLDVIAFSSVDDDAYQSIRGYKLDELFNIIRTSGDTYSRVDVLIQQIGQLFQDEMDACCRSIEQSKKLFEVKNSERLDVFKFVNSDQINNNTFIRNLKAVLLESYNELVGQVDSLTDLLYYTLNSNFIDFYNKIISWDNDRFLRSDTFDNICLQALENIKSLKRRYEKEIKNIARYDFESRKDLVDTVENELKKLNDMYRDHFLATLQEQCDSYSNNIKAQEEMIKDLERWQETIVKTLKETIEKCRNTLEYRSFNEVESDFQQIDVFSAIRNEDKMSFMLCFKTGLNIEELYYEGYTPLTYAVKLGANDFVQFFINQNVDLGFKDQRGYNAYLTAVENNYKDLCQLLADARPDLVQSLSADGKCAIEIAEENKFTDWLTKKI